MLEEIRTSVRIKIFLPIQTLIVEFPLTNCQSMLFPVNLHVLTTKPVIKERPEHINLCLTQNGNVKHSVTSAQSVYQ